MIMDAEKLYTLYILKCGNEQFYIGITSNLTKRLNSHMLLNDDYSKLTKQWTKYRQPVELVFQLDEIENAAIARRLEKYLKVWTRSQKEQLINGDIKRNELLKLHFIKIKNNLLDK